MTIADTAVHRDAVALQFGMTSPDTVATSASATVVAAVAVPTVDTVPTVATPPRSLSTIFDLADLGEGNPIVGLNALVMMALTLANLSPGSRLVHQTGTESVGTGFLAAGSLASSHFDDIMDVAIALQDNIGANVDDMKLALERESATPHDIRAFDPSVMQVASKYPAMLSLLKSDQPELALEVLFKPPPFFPELVRRQLVVARATDARQLLTAAAAAHAGKLLAAIPVTSARQAASLAPAISALRTGTVTAAMDYSVLASCLSGASEASWVTSLPWLGDHPAPHTAPLKGGFKAREVRQSFGTAVRKVFRKRLAGQTIDVTVTDGYRTRIAGYMSAVASLEPLFPGISGTVRRLPTSLAFGLFAMFPDTRGDAANSLVKYCFDTALTVVKRMASVRTQIDDNSAARRLRVLAVRIAAKLEAEPCDARALTRKCHRLRMADCRSGLALLEELGCATERNNAWALTMPAADVVSVIGKVLDV